MLNLKEKRERGERERELHLTSPSPLALSLSLALSLQCWDWYGANGDEFFDTKSGVQLNWLLDMMIDLRAPPPQRSEEPADDWTLRLLTDAAKATGAVCLDGSPPGYYIRPGVGADARKFKIHFKGGGWCLDDASCYARSQGWLGSSKTWGAKPATGHDATHNPSEGTFGLLSNASDNPLQNWTAIFVEYCDGTSYTSERAAPVIIAPGKTIYYRGKRIFDALVDDWLASGGMDSATDVVMSGTSAGGLTCYLHAEALRRRLPKATKLWAVPDAGFFLDLPNADGVNAWRTTLNGGFAAWNGTGNTPSSCLAAYREPEDQWHCHFPNYILPLVKSVPFFVMNSLYDSFQIGNILQLPCTPVAPKIHRQSGVELSHQRAVSSTAEIETETALSHGEKKPACNATQLETLQNYRDAFLKNASAILALKTNDGAALTGCLQHEEICRDEDFMGITFPSKQTPSQLVQLWMTQDASMTQQQILAVDVRWPNSASCWVGDHGFC